MDDLRWRGDAAGFCVPCFIPARLAIAGPESLAMASLTAILLALSATGGGDQQPSTAGRRLIAFGEPLQQLHIIGRQIEGAAARTRSGFAQQTEIIKGIHDARGPRIAQTEAPLQ